MALGGETSDTSIDASDTALQIAPPTSSDRHASGFEEMRRVGRPVLKQVNDAINRYLRVAEAASADKPNPHMSEYAGPQSLNTLLELALRRLSVKVAKGEINMSFAYDHDALSALVEEELKELLGAENIAFVTSGTAANLLLIASLVSSDENPDSVRFIARETEHTLTEEKDMVKVAGIRTENIVRLPDKAVNDGLIDPEILSQTLAGIDGPFIFQMSIPSNEGVVPSLDELKKLVDIVKDHGGAFLVDGARIMNALVHWGIGLDEVKNLGIDGISVGTSKKGGLAEVVALYNKKAAAVLPDRAKSYGHTSSKNASLAYVTGVMLTTDLWRAEAESENQSAQIFIEAAHGMGLKPSYEVCSNMVFMDIPLPVVQSLRSNPTFGEIYSDYGAEGTTSRLVFTGFESPESLASMIDALREAMRQHNDGTLGVSDESQKVTGYQSGHTEEHPASQSDEDAKLADITATLRDLAAGQTST
ncbi:aminotransferase class V-fold PLP-dependent enzyme [Candidatus Woesebacteria bacterium]|nr:aminotransferase class V-fold PLP-dependent enzyme [Candidatus Woesebacteria bacterium]